MASFGDFLFYGVVGLALVLVVEGLIYALFPDGMKRMLTMMLDIAPATLRMAGLVATIAGLGMLWLLLAL